jgi:hypothetical protein
VGPIYVIGRKREGQAGLTLAEYGLPFNEGPGFRRSSAEQEPGATVRMGCGVRGGRYYTFFQGAGGEGASLHTSLRRGQIHYDGLQHLRQPVRR